MFDRRLNEAEKFVEIITVVDVKARWGAYGTTDAWRAVKGMSTRRQQQP